MEAREINEKEIIRFKTYRKRMERELNKRMEEWRHEWQAGGEHDPK